MPARLHTNPRSPSRCDPHHLSHNQTNTMKTPTLPYGHPSTLREGPFPCKGYATDIPHPAVKTTSDVQRAWMLTNKPAYFTGRLLCDIPNLPPELRCL